MSNIGNVTIELGSGAIISNVVSNLLKGSREKLMLPLSVATAPDNNSTMAVQSAPE